MVNELRRLEGIKENVNTNLQVQKNEITKKEKAVNDTYKSLSLGSWVCTCLPTRLYFDKMIGFFIGASTLDVKSYRQICDEVKIAKSQFASLQKNLQDVEYQILDDYFEMLISNQACKLDLISKNSF